MSAITVPVSSKSTWATNRLRPRPRDRQSQLTTWTPASTADFTDGSIWSPALLEIISALTPKVAALVRILICPGDAVVRGRAQELRGVHAEPLAASRALDVRVEDRHAGELGQQDGLELLAALERTTPSAAPCCAVVAVGSSGPPPQAAAIRARLITPASRRKPRLHSFLLWSTGYPRCAVRFGSVTTGLTSPAPVSLEAGGIAGGPDRCRQRPKRSTRFGTSTEAISSAPMIPVWVVAWMLASPRPERGD